MSAKLIEALRTYLFHPAPPAGAFLAGRLSSNPQGTPGLAHLALSGLLPRLRAALPGESPP